MATLPWSMELEIGLPVMDEAHREFIDLLGRVDTISDADLPALWQELIAHTKAHFDQEDAWMRATNYPGTNGHTIQHRVILDVLREGAARAAKGDLTPIRVMTRELVMWFPQHSNAMDAPLAAHLRRVGYKPLRGELADSTL